MIKNQDDFLFSYILSLSHIGQMTTVSWPSIMRAVSLSRLSLYRCFWVRPRLCKRKFHRISPWNAPVPELHIARLSNESPVSYICMCLAMQSALVGRCSHDVHATPHALLLAQDIWYPSASIYALSDRYCRQHCLCTDFWKVCELRFGVNVMAPFFSAHLLVGCLFGGLQFAVFCNIIA